MEIKMVWTQLTQHAFTIIHNIDVATSTMHVQWVYTLSKYAHGGF